MELLDRPASDIIAVTMPCFGTTDRTRRQRRGAWPSGWAPPCKRIDIGEAVRSHFKDIGQSMEDHDVTFENGQARERTQVLMDIANQTGGLVIGTGDLSRAGPGLGHLQRRPHEHVRRQRLHPQDPGAPPGGLSWPRDNAEEDEAAPRRAGGHSGHPRLPGAAARRRRARSARRPRIWWGPTSCTTSSCTTRSAGASRPGRCYRLAEYAFGRTSTTGTSILKWLKTFYRRFFSQQFKRSCLPDGPKVGSAALSPRGDWRMPSDASAALWQAELETLE